MGTIMIAGLTSFAFSVTIFFVIKDIETVIATPTGVPILELFYQALRGSKTGASVLLSLLLICCIGCLMSIHTWVSRMAWAFARDKGFPISHLLSRIAPQPYNVPLNAHLFSSFWITVLGTLYMASTTAFNSLVTGGILMQYISYMIPVGLLMSQGRKLERRGVFWMGPKGGNKGGMVGWLANTTAMVWGTFTCVVYSFPYVMPATPGNMSMFFFFHFFLLTLSWSCLPHSPNPSLLVIPSDTINRLRLRRDCNNHHLHHRLLDLHGAEIFPGIRYPMKRGVVGCACMHMEEFVGHG